MPYGVWPVDGLATAAKAIEGARLLAVSISRWRLRVAITPQPKGT